MLTEVTAGLSALDGLFKTGKALGDLIRSVGKPGDREIELKTALSEILDAGLKAKESIFALQGEVEALEKANLALEKENARLRKFQVDREHFELRSIAPNSFAYVQKGQSGQDQAPPYFCAACFDKSERSLLQLSEHDFNSDVLQCPACNARIRCSHDRNRGGSVMITPVRRSRLFDV